MSSQKSFFNISSGILVLLFVGQILSLRAWGQSADKAETASTGIASSKQLKVVNEVNPTPAAIAVEIDQMKKLIDSQRQQIEKLQSALDQQQRDLEKAMSVILGKGAYQFASAGPAADSTAGSRQASAGQEKVHEIELVKSELNAVTDSAAQTNRRLTKLESELAANIKETDARAKQLGNFRFSGDIRARVEPFIQEGANIRTRERFRLRFNITAKVSDEFSGGFSLASGSLDDPVSTNQTLTSFFNRKNIGIDKAYVTYQPKYAKFLRLDVGRFAYPWFRTPMTFDSDVNVEGLAETLSFNMNSPIFKNLTVVGFQLPFNELSGQADSYILGGQIQAQFQLGSRMRLGLYGSGIDILRSDPIAVALGSGSLKPSLSNSNTLRRGANNLVTGYTTKFAYLDAIMKLDFDTGPRFPVSLVFNFVNNVRGPRERSGYWTELTVGKTKEAKDIQFGYGLVRIEKDAVIGAWNESDLRSSTNVLNHKLNLAYMIHGGLTGQFTAWIGKLANPHDNKELAIGSDSLKCTGSDQSGCRDNYLKRLQLDLIYKF